MLRQAAGLPRRRQVQRLAVPHRPEYLYRPARKNRNAFAALNLDAEEAPALPGPASLEPDQELELGEVGSVIAEAVGKLPVEQREVFLLRQQELAFKEIAEIQGCSINTVLGRMQYAMKSLRRLILEIDRGGIVT